MPDNSEYATLTPYSKEWEHAQKMKTLRKVLVGAGIVFVILIIVIPLAVFAGKRKGEDAITNKKAFMFEDMFNPEFSPATLTIQWGPNGGYYAYTDAETGDITKYDTETKETSLLVNKTNLSKAGLEFSDYFASPDGQYVLLATQYQQKWRHSFSAVYYLYVVQNGTFTPLIDTTTKLLNVQWSPSNPVVAYVQNNDIYIYDIISKQVTRVTNDNSPVVFNGVQSWVYEEEIFSDYNAMWWSQDGSYLAYLRSNESNVPLFSFPTYSSGNAYTTPINIPYPKAGYPNPSVSLHTYSLSAKTNLTFTFDASWEYIYTVQWGSADKLFVQVVNRVQNTRGIALLSASTASNTLLHSRTLRGWWDVSPLHFFSDYLISLEPDSSQTNVHIALRSQADGSLVQYITHGEWDVTEIVGYCPVANRVLFISTAVSPLQRHLYSITSEGISTLVQITDSEEPAWYSATLSPSGGTYVLKYGGPDVPQQFLRSTTDESSEVLLSNEEYAKVLEEYRLPIVKYITVKNAATQDMNVQLLLPFDFDEVEQYPVLVDVYGGPNTQDVTYQHMVPHWETYLTGRGYIYARIDGRGTGGRGLAWLWATYGNLGNLETQDQNHGARSLANENSFINPEKMAIWGWSYGGYMTAQVMSSQEDVFKAGISVAPVTDWAFYDSAYTERYMGTTPQKNATTYLQSSVIPKAKHIPSNSFLLVHGTSDDNVHWMNSAVLEDVLIQENIQFETMNYINQNHAIRGGNSRQHLFTLMSNFLSENIMEISEKTEATEEKSE